ncbi:MAG: hypothetical protein HXX12_01795 [Geothrix sp.]|uniref:hypothetical protein n=1 Tax=Geothrix sp. TaxID=1962974 RepID=UPI00180E81BF|nr:hypothetical protein [Geothrix sp.]NWJ39686.1 hypothetical protein [Geothrix sp.]WIL22295.1 MAG: hypothetical protein QOZ81_001592 [Geothrix sp.]
MKRPVFAFEAELLTDAPFDHIAGRLRREGPQAFKSLGALSAWAIPEDDSGRLVCRWERMIGGAEESGSLTLAPDAKGAHLRLEGRMRGWPAFLLFGLLRWRTDRLLDRFVEEL